MKKIVRIGGGSSGYTLLRSLKRHPVAITAIVNMFDSGGSSGTLRDELGILPPGDVRRALAALADGEQAWILRELFNYRFDENGSVGGHSFGNLLLAALTDIYGNDLEAIRKASEILHLKGKVLPVSLDPSHLHAILDSGEEVAGETNIDIPKHDGAKRIQKAFLKPPAKLLPEARQAIGEADIVVIGPGDLYTSIVTNLLVEGMSDALQESPARKVVVCNLMTKWGETNGFTASDMLREVLAYSGLKKFDYAICNTEEASAELIAAYRKKNQEPMVCDADASQYAHRVITGELLSETDIARHDTDALAKIIVEL